MANSQNRFFSLPGLFPWLLLVLAVLVPPLVSLSAAEPPLRPEIRQYLEDQGVKAAKFREIEVMTATDRGGLLSVVTLAGGGELHVLQVGLSAKDVFRFYRYNAAGALVSMAEADSTYPWDAVKGELDFASPQPQPAKRIGKLGGKWKDGAGDAEILRLIATGQSPSRDISESIIRK